MQEPNDIRHFGSNRYCHETPNGTLIVNKQVQMPLEFGTKRQCLKAIIFTIIHSCLTNLIRTLGLSVLVISCSRRPGMLWQLVLDFVVTSICTLDVPDKRFEAIIQLDLFFIR